MYKATLVIVEPDYINTQILLLVVEECISIKHNRTLESILYTDVENITLLDHFIHIRLFTEPFDMYIHIENTESLHNCFEKLHAYIFKIIKNTYNPIHFNQTI